MSAELVLLEQVQGWADRVAPGRSELVQAAVDAALKCYAGGASVSEACEEARRVVWRQLGSPRNASGHHLDSIGHHLPAAS